jgi:hypothetical protein
MVLDGFRYKFFRDNPPDRRFPQGEATLDTNAPPLDTAGAVTLKTE